MLRFISILSASMVVYGFLLDKDPQQGQGQAQYLSVSTYMTDQTHINHEIEKLRSEQELTMNLLTKQLKQKFNEMQSQISQQSAVNESCLLKTAVLEQKYLELEENNTRLLDSLKGLQTNYASLNSALENKTTELKNSLQELKHLKNIQQLQTVDMLQQKLQTMETLVNSLRSHEQARNQDFLALYNLTINSQSQIQETNKMTFDRFDNITVQSQKMISGAENRSIDRLHNLEERLNRWGNWQNESITSLKQQVALSACVATSQTVSPHTNVKFPTITTSEGLTNQHITSFKSSGVFVCEVPGLYHISVEILSRTNGAYLMISKNNMVLVRGHSNNYDHTHGDQYTTSSAIVATKLLKGDTISINTAGYTYKYIDANYSCLTIIRVN